MARKRGVKKTGIQSRNVMRGCLLDGLKIPEVQVSVTRLQNLVQLQSVRERRLSPPLRTDKFNETAQY